MLKVTVLILNLICVLLVLIILFSNHIPVTERDGEYWSLNDIAMLDVESNKLSVRSFISLLGVFLLSNAIIYLL